MNTLLNDWAGSFDRATFAVAFATAALYVAGFAYLVGYAWWYGVPLTLVSLGIADILRAVASIAVPSLPALGFFLLAYGAIAAGDLRYNELLTAVQARLHGDQHPAPKEHKTAREQTGGGGSRLPVIFEAKAAYLMQPGREEELADYCAWLDAEISARGETPLSGSARVFMPSVFAALILVTAIGGVWILLWPCLIWPAMVVVLSVVLFYPAMASDSSGYPGRFTLSALRVLHALAKLGRQILAQVSHIFPTPVLAGVLLILATACLGFAVGSARASSQEDFLVTEATPRQVVLMINGDSAVVTRPVTWPQPPTQYAVKKLSDLGALQFAHVGRLQSPFMAALDQRLANWIDRLSSVRNSGSQRPRR